MFHRLKTEDVRTNGKLRLNYHFGFFSLRFILDILLYNVYCIVFGVCAYTSIYRCYCCWYCCYCHRNCAMQSSYSYALLSSFRALEYESHTLFFFSCFCCMFCCVPRFALNWNCVCFIFVLLYTPDLCMCARVCILTQCFWHFIIFKVRAGPYKSVTYFCVNKLFDLNANRFLLIYHSILDIFLIWSLWKCLSIPEQIPTTIS